MIVAFLGAWSGYAILGIIRIHGYADFSDYLIGAAMMLAKSGAWTNTIIFIWMNQEVLVLKLSKRKSLGFFFTVSQGDSTPMDFE